MAVHSANQIEKEVVLTIRVPADFDREDERMLDDAFSAILEQQGWELINSKEYRAISPEEPIPVNRVTIIRERYSERESWSDDFWVDASKTPSVSLFKEAIEDFLMTPGGTSAIEATIEDFNWGDAMIYVPTEIWNKHGIYPLDPQCTTHEMGLKPTSSEQIHSFTVYQDEILIPDSAPYYEWKRNEEAVSYPAISLPRGWLWRRFPDGSGSLCSPDEKSYFQYDLSPYSGQGGIEYRVTDQEEWNIFWGSFDAFNQFAEQHISHHVLQNTSSLSEKVQDAESRSTHQSQSDQAPVKKHAPDR